MKRMALSLVLAVGCDQGGPSREELARKQAEADSAQAVKDATDAKNKLEAYIKELDELERKIQAAVDNVAGAETDARRKEAKMELVKLLDQKAELVRRIAEARAAVQVKGVKISKECMDNPLAKGCS